jgi:hypothetical protein
MNQDVIEHMWKVASNNPNHDTNWHDPVVMTFAHLVARYEREACAKVCDNRVTAYQYATDVWAQEHINEARHLAKAIRARGQE